MIKVNLLRSRVTETMASTATSTGIQVGGGGGDGNREVLVKVAVMALFTVGLMLYESQSIRSLNDEQARLQAQIAQLQTESTAKAAEVAKVKDIEVLARELTDKLKILKLLSKLRLREVKTLDFMQSSVPEKVWLKAINYESDKTHVEGGHFQFSGYAVATEELTEFVKRHEESAYLMDVIVVKNQELSVNKATPIREFLFTAEVENKN